MRRAGVEHAHRSLHVNERTVPCPHCAAPQRMAGPQLQRCTGCGKSFYPNPAAADPVAERKHKMLRALRGRAERGAEDSIARYQVLRGFGILVLAVCALQLMLGAVMISGRGNSIVILRHEEPAKYWQLVALTFVGGVGLTALGHVALRQIRASIKRRFPQDEP